MDLKRLTSLVFLEFLGLNSHSLVIFSHAWPGTFSSRSLMNASSAALKAQAGSWATIHKLYVTVTPVSTSNEPCISHLIPRHLVSAGNPLSAFCQLPLWSFFGWIPLSFLSLFPILCNNIPVNMVNPIQKHFVLSQLCHHGSFFKTSLDPVWFWLTVRFWPN